jgi:hypothetical protein
MFIALFNAILFGQSGVDKLMNYTGNLAYFKDHFKDSILAPTVGLLMPVITVLELAAAIASLWGVVDVFLSRSVHSAFWGAALSASALLCLFFGQRVAKDYAGAAALVPYFLVAVLGMITSAF